MVNFLQTRLFLGGKEGRGEERVKCPMQTSEFWHYITHSEIVALKHYKATARTTTHANKNLGSLFG